MIAKKSGKGKWIQWAVVLTLIAVLAVFAVPNILSMIQGNRSGTQGAAAVSATSNSSGRTQGNYQTVSKGQLQVTVYGSGSLAPQETYDVFNETEGKVETVAVNAGDTVKSGDVLVRLSSTDIEKNIKTYEKELFTAQVALSEVRDSGSSYYVYAPSAGTLKVLKCEADDDVASVMSQYGYLAIISRDDKMRVEFEPVSGSSFTIGDKVSVWVKSTEVTGTVDQTVGIGNNIAVTIDDDGYDIGEAVMITTLQGEKVGEGSLEINMPVPITAIGGTVDTVYYEEEDSVDSGAKLFYTTGRLPSSELQSALLTYDEARTALDTELEKRDNLTVRSPMDGVVTSVNVSNGARLDESTSLVTVQSASRFQVVATVDELDIVNVKLGQAVKVEIDAYDGETFSGTVERISGVGTVSGGVATYDVTVALDENPKLMDGMTASIEIVVADKQDALLVPVEAISTSNGQKFVTLQSGTTVNVTTGLSNDNYVEVTSGVSEGDSVLITRTTATSSSTSAMGDMPGGDMGMMGMMGGGAPSSGGPASNASGRKNS